MAKTYTNEEVIERLRDAAGWKGATKLADRIGVAQSFLSEVMNSKRPPSDKVLAAVGLQWAIVDLPQNNSCNTDKGSA
jgi:hypothetical protein